MIMLNIMELETLSIIYVKNLDSKSRNFVKGVINKCSVCRKFEGPCYDYPKLGPLPESRVNFDFP